MPVVKQLVRLSRDHGWSAPEVGRRLGGKTGQWFRDIAAGRNNMLVKDAEALARILGARVTVETADAWTALDAAIEGLPEGSEYLQRALRSLVQTERSAPYPAAPDRLRRVAELAPRKGKR